MSNTFNFKRFWNYLVHDLRSACADSGVTLAIVGAMPVFMFFIAEAYSLIFRGEVFAMGAGAKIAACVTAAVIAVVFFPARHYGSVTDRKAGSDWILLPASRLEKWLSVLLVTCVAVPLFLLAELCATDGLLSLVFGKTYGATAIAGLCGALGSLWAELERLAISWPYALYLSWCENILLFTLGAIFFKKSKIGLTFLSYFLLMMAISMGSVAIMRAIGLEGLNIDFDSITEEGLVRTANIALYVIYFIWFAVSDLLLYLRIKTLKH